MFARFAVGALSLAPCATMCAPPALAQDTEFGYTTATVVVTGTNASGFVINGNYSIVMTYPFACDVIGEDIGQPEYSVFLLTVSGLTPTSYSTTYTGPNFYGPGTYQATAFYSGYDPGQDEGDGIDDCYIGAALKPSTSLSRGQSALLRLSPAPREQSPQASR